MGIEGTSKETANNAILGSIGAPMPGVVVHIHAEEGASVQMGDPLVVLSAMKMETIVAAPCSGTVKRIPVTVGDRLNAGDLTIEIHEKE